MRIESMTGNMEDRAAGMFSKTRQIKVLKFMNSVSLNIFLLFSELLWILVIFPQFHIVQSKILKSLQKMSFLKMSHFSKI